MVNLLDKTYQGLTWNDDTLVVNDLNQDGISDYTASFSQLIALEDDTLEFSISSPTDPEMTALDYFDNQPTVHGRHVGLLGERSRKKWQLVASTDSSLYLRSVNHFDSWYAARYAAEHLHAVRT